MQRRHISCATFLSETFRMIHALAKTPPGRATLKKLAAELGVSVTTVSRALGGYPDVAQSTRLRILEASERHQYVSNSAAKMLVTGRSGFVSLLMPLHSPILDPFLGEFVVGLSEGLNARDRNLFIATAPDPESEITVLKRMVESAQADAVILNRVAETDARVEFLLECQFPFITHGRTLENQKDFSWIDTDGEWAFAEAFRLLYDNGHRQFGLLSISEHMTFRHLREQGLESAIVAADDPQVTLETSHVPRFDVAARTSAITAMLASSNRPTAILALTDELALSVLQQAANMNIRVPDQLSVIGFDNILPAAYAPPGLTTFDQSIRVTAQEIARVLVDNLDGIASAQQRIIRPILIERGSHGPVI